MIELTIWRKVWTKSSQSPPSNKGLFGETWEKSLPLLHRWRASSVIMSSRYMQWPKSVMCTTNPRKTRKLSNRSLLWFTPTEFPKRRTVVYSMFVTICFCIACLTICSWVSETNPRVPCNAVNVTMLCFSIPHCSLPPPFCSASIIWASFISSLPETVVINGCKTISLHNIIFRRANELCIRIVLFHISHPLLWSGKTLWINNLFSSPRLCSQTAPLKGCNATGRAPFPLWYRIGTIAAKLFVKLSRPSRLKVTSRKHTSWRNCVSSSW